MVHYVINKSPPQLLQKIEWDGIYNHLRILRPRKHNGEIQEVTTMKRKTFTDITSVDATNNVDVKIILPPPFRKQISHRIGNWISSNEIHKLYDLQQDESIKDCLSQNPVIQL